MKEQNISEKLSFLYLSWFGVGYARKAPGTFGSLAALPFLYLLHWLHAPVWFCVTLFTLMTLAACWVADIVQRRLSLHDPQWIVVDEVIGMGITWLIVRPESPGGWLACFIAFRFFDIVKIWPASYFDKRVKSGAGTILDDVVSAFYAGIFVWPVVHLFLCG